MNKQISIGAGIFAHLFAWVIPLIYVASKYDFLIETPFGRMTLALIVSAAISLRYVMSRLKAVSENGYGMSRELAREMRYLIPLVLSVLVLVALRQNVAGIVDVITVFLGFSIPAVFMRLISYRFSDRYINDVAPKKIYDKLK